jgi:hypothetical protein
MSSWLTGVFKGMEITHGSPSVQMGWNAVPLLFTVLAVGGGGATEPGDLRSPMSCLKAQYMSSVRITDCSIDPIENGCCCCCCLGAATASDSGIFFKLWIKSINVTLLYYIPVN